MLNRCCWRCWNDVLSRGRMIYENREFAWQIVDVDGVGWMLWKSFFSSRCWWFRCPFFSSLSIRRSLFCSASPNTVSRRDNNGCRVLHRQNFRINDVFITLEDLGGISSNVIIFFLFETFFFVFRSPRSVILIKYSADSRSPANMVDSLGSFDISSLHNYFGKQMLVFGFIRIIIIQFDLLNLFEATNLCYDSMNVMVDDIRWFVICNKRKKINTNEILFSVGWPPGRYFISRWLYFTHIRLWPVCLLRR